MPRSEEVPDRGDAKGGAEAFSTRRDRLLSLALMLGFDIVGPLLAYYWLRSAGLSTVSALVLSGVLPALGIAIGAVRHRRPDAVGILVLVGIVAGSIVGIASGNAHLVLLDGTVPTAAFGLVCLGSLWSRRPLIFRFALEAIGADTPEGRAFADRWRYGGFRHAFRVTTAVWGTAFLAAAAVRIAIIETASVGTAKATSTLLPLAAAALVVVWNVAYAKRGRRLGDQAIEAARSMGEASRPCRLSRWPPPGTAEASRRHSIRPNQCR
jgi:hypothetical protein